MIFFPFTEYEQKNIIIGKAHGLFHSGFFYMFLAFKERSKRFSERRPPPVAEL